MEALHLLEISITLFLQNLGNWLIIPMRAFTSLGNEEFYLLIMPALYWCFDTQLGFRVGTMLLLSNSIVSTLKLFFYTPRPYWIDLGVRALTSEPSFGLPSGHAHNAVGVWGLLAASIRRRWVSIIITILIFFIGFSRIYLGVHFSSDVLIGWLLGSFLLISFLHWEKDVSAWLQSLTLRQQILLSFLSSLAIILSTLFPITLLGSWSVPIEWIQIAQMKFPDEIIDPLNPSKVFSISGTWFGITAGFAWLKHHYRNYNSAGTMTQRSLRYLVGLIGIGIFYFGLGSILPRNRDFLGNFLRYIRYSLVGLWIFAIAPVLFSRLNLIETESKNISTM